MKINVLIIAFLMTSIGLLSSQTNNFWQETSKSIISTKKSQPVFRNADEAKFYKLDLNSLKSTLQSAPKEFDHTSGELIISFPLHDGTMERFRVNESPVMAPGLAAKYPNIKTYSGRGIDNPRSNIRFEYTAHGFSGSIVTGNNKVFIDPIEMGNMEYVVVFEKDNLIDMEDGVEIPRFSCGADMSFMSTPEMKEIMNASKNNNTSLRSNSAPVLLRVHKLALACTGEFAVTFGHTTKEGVNSTYATILNRVNQIFQSEVAVKHELIELNDNLIYLDPDTDPYDDANFGGALLGQNRPVFTLSGVFDDTYDIGHVFTGGCNDVGGVVSGGMCTDGKMRGVTCVRSIQGAVDIMAHEIGHQYSCGHSWDNCPASAQQRASQSSYEPGSGSTIMSYAGTCGAENIINGRGDEYYNIGSLESFIAYVKEVHPTCGTDVNNGNNAPTVVVPYEDGFYIPASTPFELTAIGFDEDGDDITYCWEQHDLEINPSTLGMPVGNAPIFRSRPPVSSPTRIFPAKNAVLNNTFNDTEIMPTYDRDLTFTCTVRDNVADGGGTVWDEVAFKVDGESGPFRLEFPTTLDHSLTAGERVEFTWDPANSQNAPVNCKTVNLLLSYDDANNFTDTLGKEVINDGSYFVDIPDSLSNIARIKIEAANNIFFDYSNFRIRINEATEPRYTFNVGPEYQEVCVPANVSIDINTGSVLGFDNSVELSIISELPAYVNSASFSNESLVPGEGSALLLDIEEPGDNTSLELTIQAVSENADTSYRTVVLDLLSNDFSSLALDGPADGISGVVGAPDFVWSAPEAATSFSFELATSPDFNAGSIVAQGENLTDPTYNLSSILEPSTLYYWRVTPSGICGAGEPSIPSAFHSATVDCQTANATDLPIVISTNFAGDLESKINVTQSGTISDVNVTNVTGTHGDFSDLSFSLKSPAGTLVNLVSNKCFAVTGSFDLAFDQESPFTFQCPPRNVFVPAQSLAAFTGENSEGIWELIINDRSAQFGGRIESWSLEFCSSVTLDPPTLTRNNALLISEDFEKVIDNNKLRVEDANNADFELQYTIVKGPSLGDILVDGTALQVGDKFSQFDLNNSKVSYRSNSSVEPGALDNFYFTVIDGDGGWTGTHRYDIEFVELNTNTNNIKTINVEVFPNPVSDLLYVATNNSFALTGNMEVYNLQGQLMIQQGIRGNVRETINTAALGNGFYFLKIQDGENYSITKFVVER